MKDQLGQSITRGDTVAYASRKGARMWIRALKVLDVRGNRISGLLHPSGRAVSIERRTGNDLVVARGDAL